MAMGFSSQALAGVPAPPGPLDLRGKYYPKSVNYQAEIFTILH
jgi:hypothetical protein